jgi:RimJ/RimL family protein N-acetyltransferase
MYTYDDIAFRPMERSDIEAVRIAHNDPTTLLQMGDPTPVSPEQQAEWFAAMSKRTSNVTFMVCKRESGEPIGVWRLQNVDSINRVCEVGADIFPDFRRQGYGLKTYRMLLAYLFEHYNIHTVYLRTAEFNSHAQHLYVKLGFRETGRIVESMFRQGRYWDNLIMCMTVDEYRRIYGGSSSR